MLERTLKCIFPLNLSILEINFQTLENISTDKLLLYSLDAGWWSKLSWIYFSATTAFHVLFRMECSFGQLFCNREGDLRLPDS